MSWTESKNIAEIKAGPYLLGKGSAGSETDFGEIRPVSARIYQIWEHLSSTHSTVTHTIKVLRDGEIREFRWILSAFQPAGQ